MAGKSDKRRHIRFNPDPLAVAYISLKEAHFVDPHAANYTTDADYVALIQDESYEGCSLIVSGNDIDPNILPRSKRCVLKVGQLGPMRAEVMHCDELSEKVLKIGFSYID